jgi:hypothetical protein
MNKHIAIAAAAALILSSGTAFAAKEDAAAPSEKPVAAKITKTRYCVKQQVVTGTMIERKVCKTLEQWRAIGFDPTEKQQR